MRLAISVLLSLLLSSCASQHTAELKLPPMENTRELRFAIHGSLPVYVFNVVTEQNKIRRIEVSDAKDPNWVLQILSPEPANTESSTALLNTADYNFDGYQDLRLVTKTGYQIWLFDPGHKLFTFARELSQLSSPNPLPGKQLIREISSSCGGIDFTSRDYKLEAGKLHLVREVVQSTLTPGCKAPLKREVFRYKNKAKSVACNVTVNGEDRVHIQKGDMASCLADDFPLVR